MMFGTVLRLYGAFFSVLVYLGINRTLFNVLWFILGGSLILRLALWSNFYGFRRAK